MIRTVFVTYAKNCQQFLEKYAQGQVSFDCSRSYVFEIMHVQLSVILIYGTRYLLTFKHNGLGPFQLHTTYASRHIQ
jgi:hypothetical protein